MLYIFYGFHFPTQKPKLPFKVFNNSEVLDFSAELAASTVSRVRSVIISIEMVFKV